MHISTASHRNDNRTKRNALIIIFIFWKRSITSAIISVRSAHASHVVGQDSCASFEQCDNPDCGLFPFGVLPLSTCFFTDARIAQAATQRTLRYPEQFGCGTLVVIGANKCLMDQLLCDFSNGG